MAPRKPESSFPSLCHGVLRSLALSCMCNSASHIPVHGRSCCVHFVMCHLQAAAPCYGSSPALCPPQMLLEDSQHGDHAEEKVQQYRRVQLVPAVLEQDWCVAVPGLLALPEHDAREKVLKAVAVLMEFCRERFRGDAALGATLGLLRSEYEELAAAECRDGDGDGYFQELLGSVNSILRELG